MVGKTEKSAREKCFSWLRSLEASLVFFLLTNRRRPRLLFSQKKKPDSGTAVGNGKEEEEEQKSHFKKLVKDFFPPLLMYSTYAKLVYGISGKKDGEGGLLGEGNNNF